MDQFSNIVHQILVNEKRYDVKQVAHEMGMKYDTFYARLVNRVAFKPHEIKKLIEIITDHRLITYFLKDTGFIAVNKLMIPENPQAPEVMDGVLDLVLNASNVLKAVKLAMNDKLIDHNENKKILNEIEVAEQSLVLLSHRLSEKK